MPNVERMTQLRRVLVAAPADRLHMDRWCDPKAPCGTAYCLAGLAAIDPWFREHTPIGDIFAVEDGDVVIPIRTANQTFFMLADLFDIMDADADVLFGDGLDTGDDPHAVTKAEVLDNIDAILAGRDPEPYAALDDEDEDDDYEDDYEDDCGEDEFDCDEDEDEDEDE